MTESVIGFFNFLAETETGEKLNVLLVLGIAIFFGTIGARLFQKIRVPQVVGYIVIGLLLGQSGFKIADVETINRLEPLSFFALGIIGFMIGGELKFEIFKKYGKQFTAIMLGEGLAAFVVVGALVFGLCYFFLPNHDLKIAIAIGVVLGAIAAATDPASTIQVLWEYKTRGALTTSVIAVVALDDALALGLYAIGSSVAGALAGGEHASLIHGLGTAGYELFFALVLGFVSGLILFWILSKVHDPDSALTFSIGAVLLVLGLSIALDLDVILAAMALGMTMINAAPRKSERAFEIVKKFAPPIYVIFFVFVGARLQFANMPAVAWMIVAAYVIGRSLGKVVGAYYGGVFAKARPEVKSNLGMCLFAQGGVAIGLSILAAHRFPTEISSLIVLVVAFTTFIVQIIGPLFVKLGVTRAGEVGLNVTEEDLVKIYKVADVFDKDTPVMNAGNSLREIVDTFSSTDSFVYPVIDHDRKLIGVITLSGIRNFFKMQELGDWLVAMDIMEPVTKTISPDTPLENAFETTRHLGVEYLPVTASTEDNSFLGLLDTRAVHRALSGEVLARQQKADKVHSTQNA